MDKKDLRTTLGSIHANDELVRKTMARIDAQRAQSEERENARAFNFGFGMRLAGAMCAFMLVVGVGVYGAMQKPPVGDQSSYGIHRAAEMNDTLAADKEDKNPYGLAAMSLQTDELIAESENIDGNWAIIRGIPEACYFAGGEEAGTESRCIIAVSVENVEAASDGIVIDDAEISAVISFENESEMQKFIDNLSSNVYFLLAEDKTENGTVWTVEKFIYEN